MPLQFYPDHFKTGLTPEQKRELFCRSVTQIELEVSSFCNRTCSFCPNASIPSRQDRINNKLMDPALYTRILWDLAAIGYNGAITYSRYNEPLADRGLILERLREAHGVLPGAHLSTHTNGDYLTRDYMDALRGVGLNTLAIQSYLGNGETWTDTKAISRINQQLRKLGLGVCREIMVLPGRRYYWQLDYPGMLVTLDTRNFQQVGTDRGGLVQLQVQHTRTSPCWIVFEHLYVDWNGAVVPCCNIRSDVAEHAGYVVGQLGPDYSVFDAYADLQGWRRELLTFGEKRAPCSTCNYETSPFDADWAKHLDDMAAAIQEYR